MKICLCNRCACTAKVERPELLNVCDNCHEFHYNSETGNIRDVEQEFVIKRNDCVHPSGGCPWACEGYIESCFHKMATEKELG